MPNAKAFKSIQKTMHGYEVVCYRCNEPFLYWGMNREYAHCNKCNATNLLRKEMAK
jgi:uncharacterized protein (DUF983 family)